MELNPGLMSLSSLLGSWSGSVVYVVAAIPAEMGAVPRLILR